MMQVRAAGQIRVVAMQRAESSGTRVDSRRLEEITGAKIREEIDGTRGSVI